MQGPGPGKYRSGVNTVTIDKYGEATSTMMDDHKKWSKKHNRWLSLGEDGDLYFEEEDGPVSGGVGVLNGPMGGNGDRQGDFNSLSLMDPDSVVGNKELNMERENGLPAGMAGSTLPPGKYPSGDGINTITVNADGTSWITEMAPPPVTWNPDTGVWEQADFGSGGGGHGVLDERDGGYDAYSKHRKRYDFENSQSGYARGSLYNRFRDPDYRAQVKDIYGVDLDDLDDLMGEGSGVLKGTDSIMGDFEESEINDPFGRLY